MRTKTIPILAAAFLLAAFSAPAPAATSKAQRFFRAELLKDKVNVGETVRENLRTNAWRVDRDIVFSDTTRDGKQDAIVRIYSGTTGGDVAIYVFSGGATGKALKVVFAREDEYRLAVAFRAGHLRLTTPRFAPGDPSCCPSAFTERAYRWEQDRFVLRSSRRLEVTSPAERDV